MKAALRKLVRALPEPFRAEAEAAASAVVLDPPGGTGRRSAAGAPGGPPTRRRRRRAGALGTRVGSARRPNGSCIRWGSWRRPPSGTWSRARTRGNGRSASAGSVRGRHRSSGRSSRGFDLADAWEAVKASIDERRAGFQAVALVDAETARWLRGAFGTRLHVSDDVRPDGRSEVRLRSWSAHSLAAELASFGNRIEVLEPPEVRHELARIGADLAALYVS